MQFFDVFNPRLGVGLAFLTHNLNQDMLDYSVRKNAAGVEAFVQYPAEYHVIRPGGEMKLTETCLVFHGGDWHGGLAAYQAVAADLVQAGQVPRSGLVAADVPGASASDERGILLGRAAFRFPAEPLSHR